MKKILIVQRQDLKVLHRYEAEAPSISSWGGLYGDAMQVAHIACPVPLDPDCVKVILDQMDNMMVVEDSAKIKDKQDAAWEILRAGRNKLLAECDWTQVSDAPLNEQDKENWKAYRQSLRDMPELTVDPENPSWPEKPDMQV